MSLVKCPECKRKISDKAVSCPKCGCPLGIAFDSTLVPTESRKQLLHLNAKVLKRFVLASFLISFIALVLFYVCEWIYEASQPYQYPLFEYCPSNSADPYGLAGEHNVLGKNINEVLEGYAEGVDYSITQNEYFCSYTFNKEFSYSEKFTAKLTLYTSADSDYINMVEYAFRVGRSASNSTRLHLAKIKGSLTSYYDVDPTYAYVGDYTIVDVSKDEFDALISNDHKTIYHIDWEGENGHASLIIANIHEERSNDWSVSFTE